MRCVVTIFACLLAPALVSADENWPEFRGPHGDGHSDATQLPVTWSETENVKWKTPIHGKGWSSPVIWGNQIWMNTATVDGKELFAVCVDRTDGKIVHDVKVFDVEKPEFCHAMNSYASCTPAIEAGRVYVHFGTYGTACLDTATGATRWARRDLKCDHFRGPASSPILYGNLLIMHFDGFDVQYIVALDKSTGKTVWKQDRAIDWKATDGDAKKAYATPLVIEVGGQPQLISPFAEATIAYDPRTGKEIWRVHHGGMNVSVRPLFGNGLVILNTAAGGDKMLAVRPNGHGDVTATHIAWKNGEASPTRPSQLLIGDLLFMINDSGVASCLEAKTGKRIWQQRMEGKYSASPLYADGRIYFFSEEGLTPVIEPAREFKELAVNKLDEGFMASPAVAGQALFLRTRTHLYRIEK